VVECDTTEINQNRTAPFRGLSHYPPLPNFSIEPSTSASFHLPDIIHVIHPLMCSPIRTSLLLPTSCTVPNMVFNFHREISPNTKLVPHSFHLHFTLQSRVRKSVLLSLYIISKNSGSKAKLRGYSLPSYVPICTYLQHTLCKMPWSRHRPGSLGRGCVQVRLAVILVAPCPCEFNCSPFFFSYCHVLL